MENGKWKMKGAKTVRLGDVCEVVLGGTPSTQNSDFWGGGVPWLTPGEMKSIKGRYVEHTGRTLSEAGLAAGSRLFPARSVILSTRAPIGYVFINTVPMCTNQGCKTLVPSALLSPEYLYYNLLGRTDELNSLGTGTTFKELSTKALVALTIPLPSLAEQKAIVARLDAALARATRLEEHYSALARTAELSFKAILNESFASGAGEGEESSKKWPVVRLGDVCEVMRGGSPRPIKDYITERPDGLHWIKIGDVSPDGKYITKTGERIIPEGLHKSRWVESGDFLLSNSMSFGRPYILKICGCIHDGWLVLKGCQKHFDQDYLYYLLRSPISQRQFEQSAQGSTVRNLNTESVANITVPLPPLSEQKTIVARLDAARERAERIAAEAQRGAAAAEMEKKALLQEAFA